MSAELSLHTIIESLELILIGAVKKPNKLSAVISFMASVTNQKPYHRKKKQKKNKATRLLPYRVHIPPVTHHIGLYLQRKLHSHKPEYINTYP